MNKQYSLYIIAYVYDNRAYWKGIIRSEYQFFRNPLDSNTTNIADDKFIIPTEHILKNNTWLWKSAYATKAFFRKIQNINIR